MVAKGTYCAKGKLMYVNTRKKSVRKRIKLDKIQNINLVYLLDFQKLLDSVPEKKIRFRYKDQWSLKSTNFGFKRSILSIYPRYCSVDC